MWIALIGARAAVGGLSILLTMLLIWPLIIRKKSLYYVFFWTAVIFILIACVVYVLTLSSNDALVKDQLVSGSSVRIFEKRLGTRIHIWSQLLYFICHKPWFGYGTGQSSVALSPVLSLGFDSWRDNLSSHSTYFELLYRLGIVGLICYVSILFSIWRLFWEGRNIWVVRVAGAFLIAVMFFCVTQNFMVLTESILKTAFGWIVLGVGAGACLLEKNNV